MKWIQKYSRQLLFSMLFVLMMTGSGFSAEKPSHCLVVTYFHTTFRCPTCHKIEEYAKDAVSSNFENEIKSGKLVWRVTNVDNPENRHFIKDYQLYTKSLIVSEMKDGKEVRWKNLQNVWTLIRDKAKFDEYVKTEIKNWLKE